MDNDIQGAFETYLREAADQPFGNVESISGRTLQPFSRAGLQAAGNLLSKAGRALAEGDADRAMRYVDRAARLPFDHHEETAPVAFEGHMMLFSIVVDALEDCPPDDSRWLDAAVHTLQKADECATYDIRDVLMAIAGDYEISSSERARIRTAVAQVPERAELRDLDLSAGELSEHVMAILSACRTYEAALVAAGG